MKPSMNTNRLPSRNQRLLVVVVTLSFVFLLFLSLGNQDTRDYLLNASQIRLNRHNNRRVDIGIVGGVKVVDGRTNTMFTQTMSCYATRHGYTFIQDATQFHLPKHSNYYNKLIIIHKYLSKFDWILWVDYDTIVENPNVRLETWIDKHPDANLIVTDQGTRVNNAAFLIRNTKWSYDFLKTWWEIPETAYAQDNGIFNIAMLLHVFDQNVRTNAKVCENMTLSNSAIEKYDECLNSALDKAGYVYGNRWVPPVWMVSASGGSLRGFQYRDHVMKNADPETLFKSGDFLLHSKERAYASPNATLNTLNCGEKSKVMGKIFKEISEYDEFYKKQGSQKAKEQQQEDKLDQENLDTNKHKQEKKVQEQKGSSKDDPPESVEPWEM